LFCMDWRAVAYLFSIAPDGRVYYLRDSDAFIRGSDRDFPQPISVGDLFSDQFRPGMHDGIQYQYRLNGL
jgi:hypothetical protein